MRTRAASWHDGPGAGGGSPWRPPAVQQMPAPRAAAGALACHRHGWLRLPNGLPVQYGQHPSDAGRPWHPADHIQVGSVQCSCTPGCSLAHAYPAMLHPTQSSSFTGFFSFQRTLASPLSVPPCRIISTRASLPEILHDSPNRYFLTHIRSIPTLRSLRLCAAIFVQSWLRRT